MLYPRKRCTSSYMKSLDHALVFAVQYMDSFDTVNSPESALSQGLQASSHAGNRPDSLDQSPTALHAYPLYGDYPKEGPQILAKRNSASFFVIPEYDGETPNPEGNWGADASSDTIAFAQVDGNENPDPGAWTEAQAAPGEGGEAVHDPSFPTEAYGADPVPGDQKWDSNVESYPPDSSPEEPRIDQVDDLENVHSAEPALGDSYTPGNSAENPDPGLYGWTEQSAENKPLQEEGHVQDPEPLPNDQQMESESSYSNELPGENHVQDPEPLPNDKQLEKEPSYSNELQQDYPQGPDSAELADLQNIPVYVPVSLRNSAGSLENNVSEVALTETSRQIYFTAKPLMRFNISYEGNSSIRANLSNGSFIFPEPDASNAAYPMLPLVLGMTIWPVALLFLAS